MKSILKNKNILIALPVLFMTLSFFEGDIAHAREENCRLGKSRDIFFSSSINRKKSYSYKQTGKEATNNLFIIPPCQKHFGDFLMVRVGISNLAPIGTASIIHHEEIKDINYQCKYRNSLSSFKFKTNEERRKDNLRKDKLLRKCLLTKIEIFGRGPLLTKEKQAHCTVTRINEFSSFFKGGRCLLKITPGATYEVSFLSNPDCSDEKFVRENQLEPGHLFGDASLDFTSNPEEALKKIDPIVTSRIHYNLEAPNFLMSLVEYWGEFIPQFSTEYRFPNPRVGKISIEKKYGFYHIKLPLIAKNRCQKKCDGGICSGPCNYRSPLSALFEIKEMKGNKEKLIDEMYLGNVLPGNWEGATNVNNTFFMKSIEGQIKKGKRYKIIARFGDPKFDMDMALKTFKSLFKLKIPNLRINLRDANGRMVRTMPDMTSIGIMTGGTTIGSLPVFSESFDTGNFKNAISRALSLTKNSSKVWPPYYRRICNLNGEKCINSGFDDHTVISLEFDVVDEIKNEGNEDEISYKLDNFSYDVKSKILPNYREKFKVDKFPELVCE